jgi:urea transporter
MYITRYSLLIGLLFAIIASIVSLSFGVAMGINEKSIMANMLGTSLVLFLVAPITTKKKKNTFMGGQIIVVMQMP